MMSEADPKYCNQRNGC